MLKCLDLFAGIGAWAIASNLVKGFKTVQFVEIDPDAQTVLRSHFPNVPIHSDIKNFKGEKGKYDVILCSFPCTNTSSAGDRAGLDGDESCLWWESLRVIRECRDSFVVIENPEGLRHRGLGQIIQSLAAIGYVGEWQSIRASDIGACHKRERIFVVSYPHLWIDKKGIPPSWSSQIGSVVAEQRNNSRFPTIERRDDGIAFGFPQGLDRVPIGVPKGTPGRIKSRYLYGRTIVPAQAAIALERIKYLHKWFQTQR